MPRVSTLNSTSIFISEDILNEIVTRLNIEGDNLVLDTQENVNDLKSQIRKAQEDSGNASYERLEELFKSEMAKRDATIAELKRKMGFQNCENTKKLNQLSLKLAEYGSNMGHKSLLEEMKEEDGRMDEMKIEVNTSTPVTLKKVLSRSPSLPDFSKVHCKAKMEDSKTMGFVKAMLDGLNLQAVKVGGTICKLCMKFFKSRQALGGHMTRTHKKTEIFSNAFCQFVSISEDKLKEHIMQHHTREVEICLKNVQLIIESLIATNEASGPVLP